MTGYEVFYPFGFDDNGLPTERLVEREEKIQAKNLSRSEFVDKCMKVSEKYEEEFKAMWDSLGFSVDWSRKYRTIEPKAMKISQRSFLQLANKKKAYMKESPVFWCTTCQTSIAQAELESKELEGNFHYITFMVEDQEVIVATTRPELLYGCVCLFVHPEDERYNNLLGKMARVPLYDFLIPIRSDSEVSKEKGTGIVMCATFGDVTDVSWYETYSLPFKKVIKFDGRIYENIPYIEDMKIKDAREKIVELLKSVGLHKRQDHIVHHVSVHERCQKEIEIIPSKQWYINILSEKENLLKAGEDINWYPQMMKYKYRSWVENLKWDWCISRQRYFGIPFPVWYCKSCGTPVFAREEDLPVNPIETPYKGICSCGCKEFIPENAVLDTWATSSETPFINASYQEAGDISDKILPMGMRAQAHEIIRTWTFYTIVKSLYQTGNIPWKDIMVSGYVLAKKGEKISKSKNNGPGSPNYLIETYSADVIRYWSANAKLGTDTFFHEEELKIGRRFITKLWNAAKFVIALLEDFDHEQVDELLPIDKWIMERSKETVNKAEGFLMEYEIGQARHEIDEFFWKDFCDYYIEIVKERLYQPEKHGILERKSGQYALYHTFLEILKLYSIYTPHITDYLYREYFGLERKETSIHKLLWNTGKVADENILLFGEVMKNKITLVRKYKSENNKSMKDEIDEIAVEGPAWLIELFKKTEMDMKACNNCKAISYKVSEVK
ncbi:MAG: valine--tRNA ligase [Anaerocolumna sp.]|nr:valine--tRNA ligase [Anaerocolumna sp.]